MYLMRGHFGPRVFACGAWVPAFRCLWRLLFFVHGTSRGSAAASLPAYPRCFPRAHTVAAHGGIDGALADMPEGGLRWQAYDTVKGADGLGNQAATQPMRRLAPEVALELVSIGLPFTRPPEGKIYHRASGSQSLNYGRGGQGIGVGRPQAATASHFCTCCAALP